LTTMTEIFFPAQPLSDWRTETKAVKFEHLRVSQLSSIWGQQ